MSNFFNLILDTTAPGSPTISIEGGAQFAPGQLVNLTIGTTDPDTVGYQMKIWGDVDESYDANIKDSEAKSAWITYNSSKQIKLSAGDEQKAVYIKLRDDVHNESSIANDSIKLDTNIPVVTITGPDVNKISKVPGRNVSSFSFHVNEVFVEYKVKVVNSTGANHDTGTLIGTANGSTNTAATGTFDTASTPINVQINGLDLELASAGDGTKIIKVFVKDTSGLWSA